MYMYYEKTSPVKQVTTGPISTPTDQHMAIWIGDTMKKLVFFSKTGELCHISIYEQQNYQTPNNPTKGKSKPTSIQTDKIGQQPENCENRNDPDLVQAFLKKWWVESDFKAPNLPLSLRLKVSGCHYNSIHNNTRTKQVKQLSKQRQTQWSKCQRHFYVTHW